MSASVLCAFFPALLYMGTFAGPLATCCKKKLPHASRTDQKRGKAARNTKGSRLVSGDNKMVWPQILAICGQYSPAVARGLVSKSICKKDRHRGFGVGLDNSNVKRQ